jgi:mRNA-degrading endonuclease RelE of RelBE toxin-antitoxin system
MNVEIKVTDTFKTAAKKLLKKYSSLKLELQNLEKQLTANPKMGTSLGNDCYKIRLAVKSKGKGKSGGIRVITHLIAKVKVDDSGLIKLYMVYIYDKSKFESISIKDIKKMIADIIEEPKGTGTLGRHVGHPPETMKLRM